MREGRSEVVGTRLGWREGEAKKGEEESEGIITPCMAEEPKRKLTKRASCFSPSLSLLFATNNRLAIVAGVCVREVDTERQPALDSSDRRTSRKNKGDGQRSGGMACERERGTDRRNKKLMEGTREPNPAATFFIT